MAPAAASASVTPTAIRTHTLAIIPCLPDASKTPVNPAVLALARRTNREAVAALS
jgi:hypothetical protein